MAHYGYGQLGQNEGTNVHKSSPTQIPGTTWAGTKGKVVGGTNCNGAIKTDGTLWIWGRNYYGNLGNNSRASYSSPVQVPGTTWSSLSMTQDYSAAIKTDGTLWIWAIRTK
jgi:alpha-tubulin suppressor-like RCC1 family protein